MASLAHRLLSWVSASALILAPLSANANPLNGQVVAGTATISGENTSQVIIDQSSERGIINWQSFNLAPGDTTQFIQPDASAVTLNRVTGGMGASDIEGMIEANGGVYVINPDGILFGKNAVINTGSFLATTSDIANADFMAGNLNFDIAGNPSASIVNEGAITAANGGFAALVAPGVRNDGIITANLGTVALASGNVFSLDLYGDDLISLEPSDSVAASVRDVASGQTLKSLVSNTGTLRADGGKVALTAVAAQQVLDSVINTSGTIEANSVGTRNGQVVFGAATSTAKPAGAPQQTVKVSGTISAAGTGAGTRGGTIEVTGENIVVSGATLDASGVDGGGTILVGGDFKGGDPSAPAVTEYRQSFEPYAVPDATTVTVDGRSTLDASAVTSGNNGGKIVVWANGVTTFGGTVAAEGGATTGNGGFAEISGNDGVNYAGIVANLSASEGVAGTILFDPTSDVVDAAKALAIGNALSTGTDVAESADTIEVDSSIYKVAGGAATLTFSFNDSLTLSKNVTIGSTTGQLNIVLNLTNETSQDYLQAIAAAFADLASSPDQNSIISILQSCADTSCGIDSIGGFLEKFNSVFSATFKQSDAYSTLLSAAGDTSFDSYITSHLSIDPTVRFYTNGGTASAQYYLNPIQFFVEGERVRGDTAEEGCADFGFGPHCGVVTQNELDGSIFWTFFLTAYPDASLADEEDVIALRAMSNDPTLQTSALASIFATDGTSWAGLSTSSLPIDLTAAVPSSLTPGIDTAGVPIGSNAGLSISGPLSGTGVVAAILTAEEQYAQTVATDLLGLVLAPYALAYEAGQFVGNQIIGSGPTASEAVEQLVATLQYIKDNPGAVSSSAATELNTWLGSVASGDPVAVAHLASALPQIVGTGVILDALNAEKAVNGVLNVAADLPTITTSAMGEVIAEDGVTTTVIGRYATDTEDILDELSYPESTDFGAKPGNFNLLNIPSQLVNSANDVWAEYNEPWLNAAIARGDTIVVATRPGPAAIYNASGGLTTFGKEIEYLKLNGYSYNAATSTMTKE